MLRSEASIAERRPAPAPVAGSPLRDLVRGRVSVGSGVFETAGEFAGLERLDRAELDETDEDRTS